MWRVRVRVPRSSVEAAVPDGTLAISSFVHSNMDQYESRMVITTGRIETHKLERVSSHKDLGRNRM